MWEGAGGGGGGVAMVEAVTAVATVAVLRVAERAVVETGAARAVAGGEGVRAAGGF